MVEKNKSIVVSEGWRWELPGKRLEGIFYVLYLCRCVDHMEVCVCQHSANGTFKIIAVHCM